MKPLPREAQEMLASLYADVMREDREAAERDPKKHRLTKVFTKPTTYRFAPAGTDASGRSVRFCWSCHRNVAGYFLGWREIVNGDRVVRDQWISDKRKAALAASATRSADQLRKRGR